MWIMECKPSSGTDCTSPAAHHVRHNVCVGYSRWLCGWASTCTKTLCVFVCESGELRHAVFETNLVLLSEPGCDSGRQPDEITRREDDDNGGKNSATKHTPKY